MMKTSPKIGPILVVTALGLGSVTLLTSAWGETTVPGPVQAAWSGMDGKRNDRLDAGGPGHGPHGPMWRCNAPGGSGPGGMHRGGWRDPAQIAKRLNAMETEIGIRANQLDAWRDFTDALLGTLQRPKWQPADGAQGGDAKPQPFALAERLADNTIARSKSAEALLKSIDVLRTKLTPEQLDKVSAIEARFRPHQGPHFDVPSPDDQKPDGAPKDGPNQGDRL
jgi:hypothetical protein